MASRVAVGLLCGLIAFAVVGGPGTPAGAGRSASDRPAAGPPAPPAAPGAARRRLSTGAIVRPARFLAGTVLVGFRAGTGVGVEQRIVRAVGGREVRVIGAGTHLLSLTRMGVSSAIAALRRAAEVRYAEPDYIGRANAVHANLPNDSSFGLQWGSQNTGQGIPFQDASENIGPWSNGTPAADDKASWAWNMSTGSRSVVIGETDTGVDYNHPDLAANIWSNPGGVGGCPAGTHGYDVAALLPSCDPMDDDADYGGHGTHVAGILGALGNNGAGVAGMNWQTTILPVKWLDSKASGTTAGLISALAWLVSAKQSGVNVRVVNDSATFPGTAYSQALSDEIDLLGSNNILFVTAAGNTGQDNDTTARYPCGYGRPNEICVTASDHNDQIPTWANYGPRTVDLAAPGVSVYSTVLGGGYAWLSGGSMASPQVAGAAALMLSNDPSLTAARLKTAILDNVDPVAGMAGLVRTGGRLDVCKAIPGCAQPALVTTAQAVPTVDGTSAVLNGAVSPQNTSTSYYFRYSPNPDMSAAASSASARAGVGATSRPVSQPVIGLQPNTKYYFQLVATNAAGTTVGAVTAFVTSAPPLAVTRTAPPLAVTRTAQPTGPSSAQPTTTAPPPPRTKPVQHKPAYMTRVLAGQTITSLLARGLTIAVRCTARCSLTAELLMPVVHRLARDKLRRTITMLGKLTTTLEGGRTLQLTIRLSRAGWRALLHSSRIALTLQLSAFASDSRRPTTSRLQLTLSRSSRLRRARSATHH